MLGKFLGQRALFHKRTLEFVYIARLRTLRDEELDSDKFQVLRLRVGRVATNIVSKCWKQKKSKKDLYLSIKYFK